jgi:hypothetical protein
MKSIFCILSLIIGCLSNCVAIDFTTYYEKSNYSETPRYEQTKQFLQLLANNSDICSLTKFGSSSQGRDLLLFIIDKNKNFTSEKVKKSGNAIVCIQACIHPGESEGKDAGLMLMRDILINNKYREQLDSTTIIFIPIFNVDGHERFSAYNRINQNGPKEMGWRTTASNYNLNRDFMKADTPEMQSWLKFYNEWLPDFLIDSHTTDGADYQYTVTYGIEVLGNTENTLSNWLEKNYIVNIKKNLEDENFLAFPYVMFRNWHDPKSGLVSWVSPPMLCSGYIALENRPSILLETHSMKDYKTRVSATYNLITNTLKIISQQKDTLQKMIKSADDYVCSDAFIKTSYPLSYDETSDSVMIEFKGYKYYSKPSKSLGGEVYVYTKEPETFKIAYFKDMVPTNFTELPYYYVIPPEWTEIIKRLDYHNIKYKRISESMKLKIRTEQFDSLKWSSTPNEGRQKVTNFQLTEIETVREFPSGSVIIPVSQRMAKILIHFLEPKCFDSFVHWGFFNTIFEQKEYAETYIMDKIADEMLKDEKLKSDFDTWKLANPQSINNQRDIVNWLYQNTPFWDEHFNIYPVGKIYDKKVFENLFK